MPIWSGQPTYAGLISVRQRNVAFRQSPRLQNTFVIKACYPPCTSNFSSWWLSICRFSNIMSKDVPPTVGNFINPRTNSGLVTVRSRDSIASTASTAYDSTEVVFTTTDNKLTYENKKDLTISGHPGKKYLQYLFLPEKELMLWLVEGVKTVDIPKFTTSIKIYLGDKTKDEASVEYATIRLPRKVYSNRMRGHYKQLYIRR